MHEQATISTSCRRTDDRGLAERNDPRTAPRISDERLRPPFGETCLSVPQERRVFDPGTPVSLPWITPRPQGRMQRALSMHGTFLLQPDRQEHSMDLTNPYISFLNMSIMWALSTFALDQQPLRLQCRVPKDAPYARLLPVI